MATIPENDERYLRQILLLGKGGCLLQRGLVKRERDIDGRSLEDILRSKKDRLQKCLLNFQFKSVFPNNADVHADIETWDISLLTNIILEVFSELTQREKDILTKIREKRNSIIGHHPAYSLEKREYNELRLELSKLLLELSSGLGEDTEHKCLEIISFTGAGRPTVDFVLKVLNDLHAFEPDQLSLLNKQFGGSLNQTEEILRMARRISRQNVYAAKGNTEKELQTIIEAKCDNREKIRKALDVLFNFVKLIQNEDNLPEECIKRMIENRIRWYDDNISLKLIEDLLNWFADISTIPDATPGSAQLGSILIPIWCFSKEGMSKLIEYMESENCKKGLSEISCSLSEILGFPCLLSWTVVPVKLEKDVITFSERSKATNPKSETKKLVLPFHVKSLEGLPIILSRFEGDEANSHLTRVSESLSKIVGANISLTTSVCQDQFTKVVDETSKETPSCALETKEQQQEQLRQDRYDERSFATVKQTLDSSAHVTESGTKSVHSKLLNQPGKEEIQSKPFENPFAFKRDDDSRSLETSMDPLKSLLGDWETGKRQQEPKFGKAYRYDERSFATVEEQTLDSSTDITKSRTISDHSKLQEQLGTEEIQSKHVLENPFTLKRDGYSIRAETDRETPDIIGIEVLPKDEILLADCRNRSLKMLSSSFKLVSYCDLPGQPWDVCYIGKGRAVVSLGAIGVQFADVSGDIILKKVVKLDHYCSGLACFDGALYITDDTGTLYTYTTDATHKTVLYKTLDDVRFLRIAISDDGELLYIASRQNGLTTIDNKGQHMSTLKTDTLNYAYNVCAVGDGTILVCDRNSQDVLQVDNGGTRVLKTFVTLPPGSQPRAMCYDRHNSRLIVGSGEYVHVFEVQSK